MEIPTNETYGERLRRVRRVAGLTQAQFADEIGCTQSQLSRHEDMEMPPQRGRALIANSVQLRYGVPSDWLLYGVVPAQRDTHQYRAPSARPALRLVQDDMELAA